MDKSNFTVTEEELISGNLHNILSAYNIYQFFTDRIGVEISFQNGKVVNSQLNFYRANSSSLGNINCMMPPLSSTEKEKIKQNAFAILRTLNMQTPIDIFGSMEIVCDFEPERKMRIKNVCIKIQSIFKSQMN